MNHREKMKDKKINGYQWFSHDRGIHSFMKEDESRWIIIECAEEQLHNGDIEFMTSHEWTLDNERKRKIRKQFKNKNK